MKNKIRYKNTEEIHNLLINNRKKYERYLLVFICIIFSSFGSTLFKLNLKISLVAAFIFGAIVGTILSLTTDKIGVLLVALFTGALIVGELKYMEIDKLPKVSFSVANKQNANYQLLELGKTNAILIERHKNGTNSFKIVELNQIDKIE
ncbi:hypothetical protein [Acinetobacter thermotolerans]|uniref:hypothetical protein n=1 Tax=Acinetobacter thermotolerans TaxID=3151487 RepID=UPI00325C22E8